MSHAGAVARELVSRRWWWVTLVVIALMILLARLGVWQLHRLQERRDANAALVAALDSAPIDLNAEAGALVLEEPRNAVALANRDVVARGDYDLDNQITLKLQTYESFTGVHLVTPLLLSGTDYAVLVDRGWIPDADVSAAGVRKYDPVGPVEVSGFVVPSEKLLRQPSAVSAPIGELNEVFRVDTDAIQPDLPYTILPFYVSENPPPEPQTEPPLLIPREVDLSEGPHMGYALQWFTFSIGLGVAYVIFVNHQMRAEAERPEEREAGS